jgi:hypothetical protein
MYREAERKNLHPDDALLARMEEEGRQETLRPAATGLVADVEADLSGERRQ